MVDWDYFYKPEFKKLIKKYMPDEGEGDSKATQVFTAVMDLVYGWYNNGDVFDTEMYTGSKDGGWLQCNDVSSYANWLHANTDAADILNRVKPYDGSTYEDVLKDLADRFWDTEKLEELSHVETFGTIYACEGPYHCVVKR